VFFALFEKFQLWRFAALCFDKGEEAIFCWGNVKRGSRLCRA